MPNRLTDERLNICGKQLNDCLIEMLAAVPLGLSETREIVRHVVSELATRREQAEKVAVELKQLRKEVELLKKRCEDQEQFLKQNVEDWQCLND